MIRYLHIGGPKCASTALQGGFFAAHPDLYHLGASAGGNAPPYRNEALRRVIEVELRMAKDFAYDREFCMQQIDNALRSAEYQGCRAVGLSSESLSFTMHNDVDVTQKAQRLRDLFGGDTRIVIIAREQVDLIRSLYREYILGGLHLSYQEFIESVFFNQLRGFLYDFDYRSLVQLYADLFGMQNVGIFGYAALRDDPARMLTALQTFLGVDPHITELMHVNESLDARAVEAVRRKNLVWRRNCGRSCVEPVGSFKFGDYFLERHAIEQNRFSCEDEAYLDEIRSFALGLEPDETMPVLSYECDESLLGRIIDFYADGNAWLLEGFGLDLRE